MSTPRIDAAQRLEEASTRALKPRASDIRWQCVVFLLTAAFVGWQVARGSRTPEWVTLPAIVVVPIIVGWIDRRSTTQPRGGRIIALVSIITAFVVAMMSVFGRSDAARHATSLGWGVAAASPLVIGAAVYYWSGMRASR